MKPFAFKRECQNAATCPQEGWHPDCSICPRQGIAIEREKPKNLVPYQKFLDKYGPRPPDIVCALTESDTLMAVGEFLESRERKLEGAKW